MKALSIKQPWAWAICNLPEPYNKIIENRTWNTKYRGEFLVHTGKQFDVSGYSRICYYLKLINCPVTIPKLKEFTKGAIIGKTKIIDVVAQSDNIWFEGEYGFVLEDSISFDEPIQYKGQLNFFNIDETIVVLPILINNAIKQLFDERIGLGEDHSCWNESVNWKNISCHDVVYDESTNIYKISISEAAPDCIIFHGEIADLLKDQGFDVDISTKWLTDKKITSKGTHK